MISDTKLQQVIGFTPRASQQSILDCASRDVVICAGRRYGKSAICAYIALKMLLEPNKKIWIVAPTYDLSQKVFEYIVKWFSKVAPSQTAGISMRPNPKIRTAMGSILECKSTENPKGLLGEELDLLIVDEASQVQKMVWETYLFPTTSSRKGKSIFISTPWGKNWFYNKWLEAKETGGAFHFPSNDNPSIQGEEWERARRMLPEAAFKQNYLATFLDDAASVFRGVRSVISKDSLEDARSDRRYVMGVDLARINDFTVLTVVDTYTHKVVKFDRFQDVSWSLQKQRIVTLAKRYNNALCIVDSTGVGGPIAEDLRQAGLNVDDYTFTNKSKEALIEKLSIFIEQKGIIIPDETVLIDELEAFGFEMLDSGAYRYSAPAGVHDDCVVSLSLAVWGLDTPKRNEPRNKPTEQRKTINYQYS